MCDQIQIVSESYVNQNLINIFVQTCKYTFGDFNCWNKSLSSAGRWVIESANSLMDLGRKLLLRVLPGEGDGGACTIIIDGWLLICFISGRWHELTGWEKLASGKERERELGCECNLLMFGTMVELHLNSLTVFSHKAATTWATPCPVHVCQIHSNVQD